MSLFIITYFANKLKCKLPVLYHGRDFRGLVVDFMEEVFHNTGCGSFSLNHTHIRATSAGVCVYSSFKGKNPVAVHIIS